MLHNRREVFNLNKQCAVVCVHHIELMPYGITSIIILHVCIINELVKFQGLKW